MTLAGIAITIAVGLAGVVSLGALALWLAQRPHKHERDLWRAEDIADHYGYDLIPRPTAYHPERSA